MRARVYPPPTRRNVSWRTVGLGVVGPRHAGKPVKATPTLMAAARDPGLGGEAQAAAGATASARSDPSGAAGGTSALSQGRRGEGGRLRVRWLSLTRAGGAPGADNQGPCQRPRIGASVSLTGGPCSSATSPGACPWSRVVGGPPPKAGGPRSTSTMRPGCSRQPKIGALRRKAHARF